MARTKNVQAQHDVTEAQVLSASNISSSDTVDIRTPTPPSVSAPPPSQSSDITIWVDNNGVLYPFPAKFPENEGNGHVVDTVSLKSVGIVKSSYLNAGALSHTVKLEMSDRDVATIKDFVKSGPIPSEGSDFYWPVTDGVAVANSKDDLTSPFGQVYDGRGKAVEDLGDDDFIPVHRIRPGVKVCVEYTPTLWSAKSAKTSRDGGPKFGSGCSLKLQAVILLEDGFNFGSPRKRRKLAE
jgi:hypothetical protein